MPTIVSSVGEGTSRFPSPTPDSIESWLIRLGLKAITAHRYAEGLAKEEFKTQSDIEELAACSVEELEEMGVSDASHRRQILDAARAYQQKQAWLKQRNMDSRPALG